MLWALDEKSQQNVSIIAHKQIARFVVISRRGIYYETTYQTNGNFPHRNEPIKALWTVSCNIHAAHLRNVNNGKANKISQIAVITNLWQMKLMPSMCPGGGGHK